VVAPVWETAAQALGMAVQPQNACPHYFR